MLTSEDVPIANPCGLDFSRMTRAEANRRFCGACRKHVHDLTAMSEGEARALLASSATEKRCVRYLADERGRIVFRPDVPASSLRRRAGVAVSLAAAATAAALSGCAAGDYYPMMGEMAPVPFVRPETATSFELVRGAARVSITDVPGKFFATASIEPVPYAQFEGQCAGDEDACRKVMSLVEGASAVQFVEALQGEGFVVVQQVKGPCPPPVDGPSST